MFLLPLCVCERADSWLVEFYGNSTLVGFLMPNSLYPHILCICVFKANSW